MTDSYLNPPFLLGAMDSTGMGGLPTLGSTLAVKPSTHLSIADIKLIWPTQK